MIISFFEVDVSMSDLKATVLVMIMLTSVLAGCTSSDTAGLEQQIIDLQESNDNLTAELESLESNINLMNSISLELQESLSSANDTLNSINIQLSLKEESISNLTSQRDSLQNDLDEAIESNSSTISSLESQLELLNLQITELSSEISDLNDQLESKEDEVTTLTNSLDALSDSMSKLTYQIFTDTQGCSLDNPTPKMRVGFDDGDGPGIPDDGILQGPEISMIFGDCSEAIGQVANIGSANNNPRISNMVEMGGNLYFTADDGVHGNELWKTDGTVGGTSMVIDLSPPMCPTCPNMDSDIVELVAGDSKLFFSSPVQNAGVPDFTRELFVSDGTASGTQLVMDIFDCPLTSGDITFDYDGVNSLTVLPGSTFGTAGGDRVVFSAFHCSLTNYVCFGEEPWISDGTLSGTRSLADIRVGDTPMNTQDGQGVLIDDVGSQPRFFFQSGDMVYFFADDNNSGRELWKIDTSRASSGATLVKDINPGSDDSIHLFYDPEFVQMNYDIYFAADNGVNGEELWKTNGFGLGTTMVKDINPGSSYGYPSQLTVVGSMLYFQGFSSNTTIELFQSDGTSDGTSSIYANGSYLLTTNGYELYYAGDNGHVWKYDGVTNDLIYSNEDEIIADMVAFGNNVYFSVMTTDESFFENEITILYETEGYADLTFSILEGDLEDFTVAGDTLFYTNQNKLNYYSPNSGAFITY